MWRFSIQGLMLVVVLVALVMGLVARLGFVEAGAYFFGPIVGAVAVAWTMPGDRWAALKMGIAGGLIQGIMNSLVFRQGFAFAGGALITGGSFLQALAIHLVLGAIFGALIGAIAWQHRGPDR